MEKDLVIKFSETSVIFTEVLSLNEEAEAIDVIKFDNFNAENSPLEYHLLEELKNLKRKTDYKTILLVYSSECNCFIPMKLLEEIDVKEISNFVFGQKVNTSNIDFNRIPELDVVNLFEFPLSVKSFAVKNFPYATLRSENMAFIRGVNQKGIFKKQLHIRLFDERFAIQFTGKGSLLFENSFKYENINDVVYYILNTIEKIEDIVKEIIVYPASIDLQRVSESLAENLKKVTTTLIKTEPSSSLNKIYLSCV